MDAIRAVDANHILFVELPMNAGAQFRLVDDPNVVYSYHDYEPFVVTHAGAEWVGDSPIPDDYGYPGPALTGLEWANYAADAATFEGQAGSWVRLDSGVLTAPAGVEFATLKPAAFGNTARCGSTIWSCCTTAPPRRSTTLAQRPLRRTNRACRLPGTSGPTATSAAHGAGTRRTAARPASRSPATATASPSGASPTGSTPPRCSFLVQAGDTFRVTGWVRAPQNQGSVSLGLDYFNGLYEDYDRARLLANVQPYLDWAAANAVPLYVGEFGAMGRAPGSSRANLVRDKIDIMNQAGVHWALWTYRNMGDQSFGLMHDAAVDTALAEVLRQGMSRPGLYLPMILRR